MSYGVVQGSSFVLLAQFLDGKEKGKMTFEVSTPLFILNPCACSPSVIGFSCLLIMIISRVESTISI